VEPGESPLSVQLVAVVGVAELGQFEAALPPSRVTEYVTPPVPVGGATVLHASETVPAPGVAVVMLGAARVPTEAEPVPDPAVRK
jgi:hypothetical protein